MAKTRTEPKTYSTRRHCPYCKTECTSSSPFIRLHRGCQFCDERRFLNPEGCRTITRVQIAFIANERYRFMVRDVLCSACGREQTAYAGFDLSFECPNCGSEFRVKGSMVWLGPTMARETKT